MGLMECIGAGFVYKFQETRSRVGLKSILAFNVSLAVSLLVGIILCYTVSIQVGAPVAAGMLLVGLLVALRLAPRSNRWQSNLWWITMSNIEMLRKVSHILLSRKR